VQVNGFLVIAPFPVNKESIAVTVEVLHGETRDLDPTKALIVEQPEYGGEPAILLGTEILPDSVEFPICNGIPLVNLIHTEPTNPRT